MAEKNTTHRSVNVEKVQGDRWRTEEEGTVEEADRNHYAVSEGTEAGGISNRPLTEEIKNQDALPDRGNTQADERSRESEDIER
jgi:hypothetical protein